MISVNRLDHVTFQPYGDYVRLPDADGSAYGSQHDFFRPDFFQLNNDGKAVSISLCRVSGENATIVKVERHSAASEGLMPVDGDILLPVVRPHWLDNIDSLEVFFVPRGTFVRLKPGVSHAGPFSADGSVVNVLILLPERTYANDSEYIALPEERWLTIERKV